jgi:hypothetical protein
MERINAQVPIESLSPTFGQFPDFGTFVNAIVFNATVIAGIILFLILVIGGFRYIMAAGGGDTKQMEKGKDAITASLIGFILIVTGVWIVQILQHILGYDLIAPPVP